jgi:hypothetical protein
MLGVGQALAGFMNGAIISFVVYSASKRLHHVRFSKLSLIPSNPSNGLVGCYTQRNAQSDVLL